MKLSKAYEPKEYEPGIYALWETSGAFAPTTALALANTERAGKGEPFSIVMPPPNANGNLHVGHAYMIPIEDILTRYYRMNGRDAIWIPGADHAGFETWVVFERTLEAEGKSRFDFSREQLYDMTWDFVEQNRGNMELQLRALGASCDWSRSVFTLDEKVVNTVYQTFKRLWDDKLIYRGERLVNYCTKHQTSFADIEVEYREEKTPLYYIKYGPFTLATTRPETKFGDTAVAIHPNDKRHQKYVGQTITVEGADGSFEVQVITDEMVDPKFGTGVVKITPAHSFDDWEVAQRHNLPMKVAIDREGRMTKAAGRFAGMPVLEARQAVIEALEEKGLLVKIDKHYKTRIGHCYKCGTIIEPLPMKQWFLKIQPLAQRAKKAIEDGRIKFIPAGKGNELIRYFNELRDWNISRQIPWGIPIPAFQNKNDPDDWIFDTRVDQEQIIINSKTYKRDDDTFDTWFSSGQWPFITTDYLTGGDLARFYPTSVMETGVDLLRQWVARMIMLGLYATDDVPFRDVFFHGLVLDEHGIKMSKSKGNVINPMDVIDEFGSDALRIGIVMNRSAGQAQAFSTASVVAGRNFCNKLWNIARFIEAKSEDGAESSAAPSLDEPSVFPDNLTKNFSSSASTSSSPHGAPEKNSSKVCSEKRSGEDGGESRAATCEPESPADHWILRQLDDARAQINQHIKNYRFAEAVDTIYHTVWDDVADWFIEASKVNSRSEFLHYVLDITLRLVHPFAPFVSETIWTALHDDDSLLISQPWPEKLSFDKKKTDEFDQIKELVSNVRLVTTQLPAGKYDLLHENDALIAETADLIKSLSGLKSVKQVKQGKGLRLATAGHAAWLDLSDELIYEHQERLETHLVEVRQEIAVLKKRLANPNYTKKAPAHLVEETKKQLDEKRALEARLMVELWVATT
ncbi:valine--tRNA ligase [Candidatus Saccharibacteria bacterium]|nr:valine--tRNA ligase [Candidatus Saccharibacteria bacterium]